MKENQKGHCESMSILYRSLSEKLASEGIKKEELEQIKDLRIGGQTVEDFVRLNLTSGDFEWRGEEKQTLVNANRKFQVKLTKQEVRSLETIAEKSGLGVSEHICEIILKSIS